MATVKGIRGNTVRVGGSGGIGAVSREAKQRKIVAKPTAKQLRKQRARQLGDQLGKQGGKKAAGNGAAAGGGRSRARYAEDFGLMTAFHHMQRASVVMSLMEEGSGEDLRNLLRRGVGLYRKAVVDSNKLELALQAIGVLRAAEHLSMAGLYAARAEHKQKVTTPTPEWLTKALGETDNRLGCIERNQGGGRGRRADLFPVTVELLRQAADRQLDAQMAFELAMAADALCFALENGL